MNFKKHLFLFAGILSCSFIMAQQPSDILSVSASTKLEKASLAFDKDPKTMWEVNGQDLKVKFTHITRSLYGKHQPLVRLQILTIHFPHRFRIFIKSQRGFLQFG